MLTYKQTNFTARKLLLLFACGALSAFKLELGHKDAERAFKFNTSALAGKKFIAKQDLFSCDLPVRSVDEGCFAFKDH